MLAVAAAMGLLFSVAQAKEVHDWKDLDKVHNHVKEAIAEMGRAAKANHYDMGGHAAKAEALLKDVERELGEAIESAKKAN
jgi:F0F1-type ATP synthase membrane subunit b/b'